MVYRRPPQQLPESEFPIVYANNNKQLLPLPAEVPPSAGEAQETDIGDIELENVVKTTSYPAVPTDHNHHQPKNYPILPSPSTEIPYQR